MREREENWLQMLLLWQCYEVTEPRQRYREDSTSYGRKSRLILTNFGKSQMEPDGGIY